MTDKLRSLPSVGDASPQAAAEAAAATPPLSPLAGGAAGNNNNDDDGDNHSGDGGAFVLKASSAAVVGGGNNGGLTRRSAGVGATTRPTLQQTTSIRKRTVADNAAPGVCVGGGGGGGGNIGGVYPQPRWPPGHESETFEAVAVKKASILSPAEIFAEIAHHGEEKAAFHWTKFALLSIVAGCYCSLGFTLCLLVGGNAPRDWLENSPGLFSALYGVIGFPFSFTIIVTCGAELFTSLCAYMMAAWWEGKVSFWRDGMRLWTLSWLFNFVGNAIMVGLLYASGIFGHNKDWYIKALAAKKVSSGWGACFVKGIFANWLVAIAVWQANAAQDFTGKAVAVWLPISAFAMLGFEHCIANQFALPMAIALGAPLSALDVIWGNLIPATLGNWIGGALCVATPYAFIFGAPAKRIAAWSAARAAAAQGGCGNAGAGWCGGGGGWCGGAGAEPPSGGAAGPAADVVAIVAPAAAEEEGAGSAALASKRKL